MDVGVIGLGNMGKPIAQNLLEYGYKVIVWNRSKDKEQVLKQAGAEVAKSPADLARWGIVIIHCSQMTLQ